MRITHFCNSFIAVEEGASRLVCDPWVGTCNYGGWLSYPIAAGGAAILRGLGPTHLYISHLHPDHLDERLLRQAELMDRPVVIKAFADKRLYRRLAAIGFRTIIELSPWEPHRISEELEIAIIPADASNQEGIADDIHYDLDTSILVRSALDGTVFFNRVDNPLSLEQHRGLKEFVRRRWPGSKIDVACLPVGASSEYPQCFLGIDRESEKARIVAASLDRFAQQLSALENEVFFPAGGSYVIPGKFSPLNRYIAQPSIEDLGAVVSASNSCRRLFHIEGGGSIERVEGEWVLTPGRLERFHARKDAIEAHRDLAYDYAEDPVLDGRSIGELFSLARARYFRKLESSSVNVKWTVIFRLYEDLRLDDGGGIRDCVKPLETLLLSKDPAQTPPFQLVCHLDRRLFIGLLRRRYLWNLPLSGSLILYERTPNTFVPSITFSLNYLTA